VTDRPLVSTVIIFLNGGRFLEDAVASVVGQTYSAWELLLVDDGSMDGSTAYARGLAEREPERIRYLHHPAHENLGMSASRNLGLAHARGAYVALLDADDVWLPHKLERQVAALERHPEAGMVYGAALYWRSWAGRAARDALVVSRLTPDRVYPPPSLLPGFLTGAHTVPCPSCILARRDAMERVGGFEAEFRTLYEDQAFFAKMALHSPILVSDEHWINYRLHPGSASATEGSGTFPDPARQRFLAWLESYTDTTGLGSPALRRLVRRERWLLRHPLVGRAAVALQRLARRWRRTRAGG
jgi:glycosyltransferase involved in cell wall biosynthesis